MHRAFVTSHLHMQRAATHLHMYVYLWPLAHETTFGRASLRLACGGMRLVVLCVLHTTELHVLCAKAGWQTKSSALARAGLCR